MSDPDQMASAGSEHVVGNLQHAFECSTRQRALSATSIVLLSFSIALADHLLDFAAQVHTDVNAFLALDEYHGVKLVAVWGVMLQGAFPELCVRKYNNNEDNNDNNNNNNNNNKYSHNNNDWQPQQ